jgi:hypothetical protein
MIDTTINSGTATHMMMQAQHSMTAVAAVKTASQTEGSFSVGRLLWIEFMVSPEGWG